MALYSGIDLHSNNNWLVVLEGAEKVVKQKKLPNDLARVVGELDPYRDELEGVAVESTWNRYLSWAFHEAAHFAVRHHPEAKQYVQRKTAKTNGIIAIRALAHKLARATYHVLKNGVDFDPGKLFR